MRSMRQSGFTLLEVIISVAILAIAMMGVFTVYSQCTTEIRRAQYRTLVTACGQQMLDMIASTPHNIFVYHDFSTDSSPPDDSPVWSDLSVWQSRIHTLPTQAAGTISVVNDPDIPHTTRVTVRITYDNYGRSAATTISMHVPQPQL